MSRQISEYFKIQPKSDPSVTENLTIKTEKEEYFEIDFSKIKMESKVDEMVPKSSKIRDCTVELNDIKNQTGRKELKLFEEVTFDDSQNKEPKNKRKKCLICNLRFNENFMELHMNKKHPNGQAEQFECDFDGKVFKNRQLLWSHMKVHLSLVECQFCSKMFRHTYINYHLKNVHATDKNFQCKICSKSFKSVQYLKNHEKFHTKAHKCVICMKMYSTLGRLNYHKKNYHENPESFECKVCGFKFILKSDLKTHQKLHVKNRPKPFKCHRCDFATDTNQKINTHQKFHERQDEKFAAMKNPIKCEKCPTFCKNQAALLKHMRVVHPKVLLQCDLCAKFIKSKSSLIGHMKIHIPKTPKN